MILRFPNGVDAHKYKGVWFLYYNNLSYRNGKLIPQISIKHYANLVIKDLLDAGIFVTFNHLGRLVFQSEDDENMALMIFGEHV